LLLFVSRLAREKNVDLLLHALALAPRDLHLAIVGDGPARGTLERLAEEVGVADRTTFLGTIDRELLPHLYASADAFVFPSSTETQGLVQAEALAAGTLVIAADVPSNRDVLGGAGRVVAATPQAFAAAFADVPATPDAAESERSRRSAQRFSLDVAAERIVDLYRSLLPPAVT
jgi:glycosyltransferase involved in cell wall biosynthesis